MIAPVGWLATPPFVDCGTGAEDLGAVEVLGVTVVAATAEDWAPAELSPVELEDWAPVELASVAPEDLVTPEACELVVCELVVATPVGVAAPEA